MVGYFFRGAELYGDYYLIAKRFIALASIDFLNFHKKFIARGYVKIRTQCRKNFVKNYKTCQKMRLLQNKNTYVISRKFLLQILNFRIKNWEQRKSKSRFLVS